MILFLKFKQQGQLLFLHEDTHLDIDPKEKYFIILSPSLYWVKKVTLPLKYVHEVKKIAATLFEEVLPSGNYNYFVSKEDDSFLVFAYEDSKILSHLAQKGIALNQVKGISFAQFAFKDLDTAVAINQEYAISKEDGIIVLLPSLWFEDLKTLNLSEVYTPKETIHLEQFSHIVDSKTLYKIVLLLTLFSGVLIAEYLYFAQQKETLEEQREKLFLQYKLKPTLMQNRAILATYKKRDEKVQKLRRYISYFLKAHLRQNEKIASINYDGTILKVTLKNVKQKDVKRVLSRFYKEKIHIETKTKAENLIVEIKI